MILKADLPEVCTSFNATALLRREELWRALGSFTGPNTSSSFTLLAEDMLTLVTASGQQGRPAWWVPTPRLPRWQALPTQCPASGWSGQGEVRRGGELHLWGSGPWERGEGHSWDSMASVPCLAVPKERGGRTRIKSLGLFFFQVVPPGRVLLLDRLALEDGWPRVEGWVLFWAAFKQNVTLDL